MWEKFFAYFRTLLSLVERSETHKKRLDELQTEVERLSQITAHPINVGT